MSSSDKNNNIKNVDEMTDDYAEGKQNRTYDVYNRIIQDARVLTYKNQRELLKIFTDVELAIIYYIIRIYTSRGNYGYKDNSRTSAPKLAAHKKSTELMTKYILRLHHKDRHPLLRSFEYFANDCINIFRTSKSSIRNENGIIQFFYCPDFSILFNIFMERTGVDCGSFGQYIKRINKKLTNYSNDDYINTSESDEWADLTRQFETIGYFFPLMFIPDKRVSSDLSTLSDELNSGW